MNQLKTSNHKEYPDLESFCKTYCQDQTYHALEYINSASLLYSGKEIFDRFEKTREESCDKCLATLYINSNTH